MHPTRNPARCYNLNKPCALKSAVSTAYATPTMAQTTATGIHKAIIIVMGMHRSKKAFMSVSCMKCV